MNPHGFPRQILSLVRLPIPPLSHLSKQLILLALDGFVSSPTGTILTGRRFSYRARLVSYQRLNRLQSNTGLNQSGREGMPVAVPRFSSGFMLFFAYQNESLAIAGFS